MLDIILLAYNLYYIKAIKLMVYCPVFLSWQSLSLAASLKSTAADHSPPSPPSKYNLSRRTLLKSNISYTIFSL